MFVLLKHLCFVDVVVVKVLVVVDEVDVDVEEVVDREVEEVVIDDVVVVVDVEDVVVVVVSQPLQVLAQFVMLATRLSHRPCSLKAMHWLGDNVSFFPSQGSTAAALVLLIVARNGVDVDADVIVVVVSHPLHVLSHPLGATRVSHKPFASIL